ncbi:Catalase-related peroxidase [Shimia sp. SK013]|uniref:catalase n=1 Tax=Shimia sp. SK013 TaxID=1389006 RepID=UPI0006B4DD10|nr:catalase [Shimia sp. SK013]KPA21808.1 Catalase-related peroxidase [Shimia sp. SK013]
MEDPQLVEDIVHALDLPPPAGSTKRRPVHTVGVGVQGHFVPSAVASGYCVAEHFQTRTDGKALKVNVRFSNGMGVVQEHDGWSDVRGMAVRFHLDDKRSTDLVAMTLPVFFAPSPKTFLEFALHARPAPCRRLTPWEKIKQYLKLQLPMPDPYPDQDERPNEGATSYADAHIWAQPAVLDASVIGAPVSYVRTAYHAVHTFVVTGSNKEKRYVRFTWAPVAGVLNKDPTKPPENEYLQSELKTRLENGTARFSLMMQVGETGDDFNDSTRQWPPHRKRIMMGTLTLESMPEDQQTYNEKLSFNPCHLIDGIEPSGDPVLHIRKDVYEYSSNRRGGNPCPFSGQGGTS